MIDQNSIEYDAIDPSVEIEVDEIMKQKTDDDFDDKVWFKKFCFKNLILILDGKRNKHRIFSIFCSPKPIWKKE